MQTRVPTPVLSDPRILLEKVRNGIVAIEADLPSANAETLGQHLWALRLLIYERTADKELPTPEVTGVMHQLEVILDKVTPRQQDNFKNHIRSMRRSLKKRSHSTLACA